MINEGSLITVTHPTTVFSYIIKSYNTIKSRSPVHHLNYGGDLFEVRKSHRRQLGVDQLAVDLHFEGRPAPDEALFEVTKN